MKSNEAYKLDHEEAIKGLLYVTRKANTDPNKKLAYLYGARFAMLQGGIPESCLYNLDDEIRHYENNIDLETEQVRERFNHGGRETEDSGSGRGD